MSKKRKRGAGTKHNRPGRASVRLRKNGIKQDIKIPVTSTKPNCYRDTGLFDVIDFEMKRKKLDEMGGKWSLFSSTTTYSDRFNIWSCILWLEECY